MNDPYDLARFVSAQHTVYSRVIAELSKGRKQSHWMWFIFPQITGLGFSAMAQRYAIGSRAEADAYLSHVILGPRLIECTRLVLAVQDSTIDDILGSPDNMKFRSCMTLFGAVSDNAIFDEALTRYFPDGKDRATLEILAKLDRE
jgi:uncharacterized protein (DUF1810 family)